MGDNQNGEKGHQEKKTSEQRKGAMGGCVIHGIRLPHFSPIEGVREENVAKTRTLCISRLALAGHPKGFSPLR